MKYAIQTKSDYIAFLHGKIEFVADDLGQYNEVKEWLRQHRTVEQLEEKLGSLLEEVA